MRITSGGNVVINSTVANYKFQVNSGINTSTATVMTLQQATNGAVKDAAGFGLAIQNGGEATNAADLIISAASGGSLVERMRITSGGTVQPGANGTQDLGTTSLRWSTVYTSDLSLSNGIGDYTIVEGENDLFLYNNKQNKVYKFMLAEVDPTDATPKKS